MPDHSDHPRNVQQRRSNERRKAKELVEEMRDELALAVMPADESMLASRRRELVRRANEFLGEDRDHKIRHHVSDEEA